ncbi:acyltransferase family protein [Serratia proteamaculans]|uniref:Acyltransferase family protein n=1 Tax=Serratia proteamaculans TaxID=28151 RepID=A0A5Q2V701_SERPR|nr:acyltransferase family protein [Serratia proteamaculans]QGH60148.1 acyltransferase family protein [Serratia proteamaculans]
MSSTARTFRHDINGLRAWAVIAVVLFHFGIPGFAGGFVGVDVFFVISGFLMTQIIVTGLETGKFSIWRFYLARARRIIPALLALCLTLLVLGWFFLTTVDYSTLSKHVLVAILFISNVKFWKESGYFDAASHEKWLLHTWSLSVEWQFYIILPIILLIMWRFWKAGGVKFTIFAGFILSFALACYLSIKLPSAAFFLLPTRAWEMLGGGAVWWLTRNAKFSKNQEKLMELVGFIMITFAIVFFTPKLAWPGVYALVPVGGAMLVLAAARQGSIFTSNYVAERVGVSSYSIYLWHWPIVVFLAYNNTAGLWTWMIGGLILSVILGELSLRLIENPTRKGLSRQTAWGNVFTIAACMMIIGVASVAMFKFNHPDRVPAKIDLIANESLNSNPSRVGCFAISGTTSPGCVFGGSKIKAILVGDSHANAMTTAVEAALPSKNDGVLNLTYAGCPTIYGAKTVPGEATDNQDCYGFNQWQRKKLAGLDKSIPIVIVNRTSVYAFGRQIVAERMNTPIVYFSTVHQTPTPEFLAEFKASMIDTACELAAEHPVFMVRPMPEMTSNVSKTISRAMMLGKEAPHIYLSESDYMKRHSFVWEAQDEAAAKCGVKILNPLPLLCKNGKCESTHDGRPIYYDDNHVSEYGNKLLVPMFQKMF